MLTLMMMTIMKMMMTMTTITTTTTTTTTTTEESADLRQDGSAPDPDQDTNLDPDDFKNLTWTSFSEEEIFTKIPSVFSSNISNIATRCLILRR